MSTVSESAVVAFVASSKEGKPYADGLMKSFIDDRAVRLEPWWLAFGGSNLSANVEHLDKLRDVDFGVLVLTPDDIVESRKVKKAAPRDNLILELGLQIGILGRERVVVLAPLGEDIKMPTDLLGTNPVYYDYQKGRRNPLDCAHDLVGACAEIRGVFERLGPRGPRITFHPKAILSPLSSAGRLLRLRFGYRGPRGLLRVEIRAFYLTAEDSATAEGVVRQWEPLELFRSSIPECQYGWTVHHRLDSESPLVDAAGTSEVSLEGLRSLSGRIAFFASGIEPETGRLKVASTFYGSSDIEEGSFQGFIEVSPDGEILGVDWSKFAGYVAS